MSKRPALGSLDKNVNGTTDTPPPKPSTTTTTNPEKRPSVMTTDIENKARQPAMTPVSKHNWKKGGISRGDENSSAPPRFHPPPPSRPQPTSSPYPFYHYPYPGAYPQPQYPAPHYTPHPQHRQPQTPYMYSPTPTLSYSPYESVSRSNLAPTKKRTTTPTPSSRAYRSHTSGSSRQSVTTPSIKTPHHSHQPTTPASAAGEVKERILLPKPQFNGPLPVLSGIEPNAMWPLHEGAPPFYLEGQDGKEVPTPEHMNQSEAERWNKMSKDSNKFRSRNPWDYIAPDSRQQFSPSQRMVLESLWMLTCCPCPKERERIAIWMGVSSSRITIWFQNRRQGIVKFRTTEGLAVAIWPGAPERHCDPHVWWANGPVRSSAIMASGEDEHYFGLVRLNNDRGYIDDNGKWSAFDGDDIPLPPAEYMEKLPILYSILRGNLDHLFFYHQWAAGSPRSSTDSVFTPVESYNAQMPPKWFDTMMLDREAGIPSGSKRRIQPEYDDEGNIRNLANLLPTDPPSESPVPMKRRTSGSVRGERCPEFAMRATSPVQFGRASGRSLYWSSQRAQHLATMGSGTASLGRTQSLPSIPQVTRPSSGGKQKLHTRPSIAMKPRSSFARSQSTADIEAGSPPMKMARREKGKKCFVDNEDRGSPSMSAVSEEQEEGMDEVKAAETLLGFSRSSASVSSKTSSKDKDEKLNE